MTGPLLQIDEARDAVITRSPPLAAEGVPLADARGRTLAEPVLAAERVPGFDNSAMDGYAVRAGDLAGAGVDAPATLKVVGESRAGRPAAARLGAGEAIAISTGAAVPDGADAVVRIEDTDTGDARVAVLAPVAAGQNVRRAGEDIEPGSVLLEPGTTLDAAAIGVLASVGLASVSCRRRPRVAVLTTGDELIAVDAPMRAGAVRNSNGYALQALTRDAGAEPIYSRHVPDDADATREAVAAGLDADLLVVCGGVSVGAHDHVKDAFAACGVEEIFWRVSLKPGKPAWFGVAADRLVFGLPGNPVSAYVTFVLLVRPALLALQGADPGRVRAEAELTQRYEKPADRAHAIRCRLELGSRGWLATPAPDQGSHVMTSLLAADGLALIPADVTAVEAGERVVVEMLERGVASMAE